MDGRNELEQLRQERERALKALIDSMSSELDPKDKVLLINFTENYEFGVALEWLYSLVVEKSIQLTLQQEQEVQRLAQLLGIDLSRIGK
jgi:hypothetical protein